MTDFVDFTLCENSLLIKDLRWMDVFGFFLLGLGYGLFYWLFGEVAEKMHAKIGARFLPLELVRLARKTLDLPMQHMG